MKLFLICQKDKIEVLKKEKDAALRDLEAAEMTIYLARLIEDILKSPNNSVHAYVFCEGQPENSITSWKKSPRAPQPLQILNYTLQIGKYRPQQ